MTRRDIALEAFNKGRDCDKSVFSAFEKDVVISSKEDKYIHNCEFPGLPHSKCGAVSGAGCVLFHYKENVGHEDTAENMWLKFKDEFIKRHGSFKCSELLGYDLSVRKDEMEVVENDICKKVCPKYIEDAVEILESVIGINGDAE